RRRKHSRRSLDRDLRQRVGSAPDVVAIMEVSASMDLIGAALTNGVDHASRGAAVLRRVIRGVDLKLLDRFLGSRIANARTAAFFGEERLVIICSVKGVVIQQSAYAAEAEKAEGVRITYNTGRQEREVRPAAAVDGQIGDCCLVERGSEVRRDIVNLGCFRGNVHRLRGSCDRQVWR